MRGSSPRDGVAPSCIVPLLALISVAALAIWCDTASQARGAAPATFSLIPVADAAAAAAAATTTSADVKPSLCSKLPGWCEKQAFTTKDMRPRDKIQDRMAETKWRRKKDGELGGHLDSKSAAAAGARTESKWMRGRVGSSATKAEVKPRTKPATDWTSKLTFDLFHDDDEDIWEVDDEEILKIEDESDEEEPPEESEEQSPEAESEEEEEESEEEEEESEEEEEESEEEEEESEEEEEEEFDEEEEGDDEEEEGTTIFKRRLDYEEEEEKDSEEIYKRAKLEEDKKKLEDEAKRKKIEYDLMKKEAEMKKKSLEEAKRKKINEDRKKRLLEEGRKKDKEEERKREEEEAKKRELEEEKRKLILEERKKKMEEEKRRKEEVEERRVADEEKKKKEAARKAEEEERRKQEEQIREEERKKEEEAEKRRKINEERRKKLEEEKQRKEEEERQKEEESEKQRKLAEEKRKKHEEEERIRLAKEEARKKIEEEKRRREEEERQKKEEEEADRKRVVEEKKKREEEKKKREEEERKEAEKIRKEEEKRKHEEKKKRKEEEEKKKKEEEERKRKRDEEERKKREEEEEEEERRKKKDEEDRRKKKEEEEKRKKKEEEENRKKKEEENRKKKEEERKKKKEEEERKKQEEEERKEEERRKKKEEEDEKMKKREEEDRKKKKEEERQKEEERKKDEEKKREEEKKNKEEKRKKEKEEEERKKREKEKQSAEKKEEDKKKKEQSETKTKSKEVKEDDEELKKEEKDDKDKKKPKASPPKDEEIKSTKQKAKSKRKPEKRPLPEWSPDFPEFFAPTANDEVPNEECKKQSRIYVQHLRRMRTWALQMYDASAKLPSGILSGNVNQFGDFDECLAVDVRLRARGSASTGTSPAALPQDSSDGTSPGGLAGFLQRALSWGAALVKAARGAAGSEVVHIRGRYCLASVDVDAQPHARRSKADQAALHDAVQRALSYRFLRGSINDTQHFVPRFSTVSWALCVPAVCTAHDVEEGLLASIRRWEVGDDSWGNGQVRLQLAIPDDACRTAPNKKLPPSFYIVIGVLICLVLLATIATLKDDGEADEDMASDRRMLIAFSLRRSWAVLNAPDDGGSADIHCMHGLRAVCSLALYMAHKVIPAASAPYSNRGKLTQAALSPLSLLLRSSVVYTDTFLLLSGALSSFHFSRELSRTGSLAWRDRYVARLFRLTPPLLAVLLYYSFVMEHMGNGPRWGPLVEANARLCRKNMWRNLLYIQNFFPFKEMCAPQTHQLALDVQLSFLSAPLVWLLQLSPLLASPVLLVLQAGSAWLRHRTALQHRVALLIYHGQKPSELYRAADLSYALAPHRATAYLVGIALGYLLHVIKQPFQLPKMLVITGWTASAALAGWAIFGLRGAATKDFKFDARQVATFNAFAPLAWAIAISWVITACHIGYGGFLSRILSSRILLLLSRISYAFYLTQFIVFFHNAGSARSQAEFSVLGVLDLWELVTVLAVSTLFTLLVDLPVQAVRAALHHKSNHTANNRRRSRKSWQREGIEYPQNEKEE